jgi:hypothetical protein
MRYIDILGICQARPCLEEPQPQPHPRRSWWLHSSMIPITQRSRVTVAVRAYSRLIRRGVMYVVGVRAGDADRDVLRRAGPWSLSGRGLPMLRR